MPLRCFDIFEHGIARRDRDILAFRIRDYRLLEGGSALGILVSRSEHPPIRVSGSTNSVWCGLIGIGGHLAMPPLPHHRAYGSVPRRFDLVKLGQRYEDEGPSGCDGNSRLGTFAQAEEALAGLSDLLRERHCEASLTLWRATPPK